MKTSTAHQLVTDCEKGNFESVNNLLSKNAKLDYNVASNIIIECSRWFYKNGQSLEVSSENLENIPAILSTCILHIGNIPDTVLLNLLRALFHIVKFIITKKHYDTLLQLRNILLKVVGVNKSSEILKIYSAVGNLIHNLICDFNVAKINDTVYGELIKLSLEMNALHLPTSMDLMTIAYSYCQATNFYESKWDVRYTCYTAILKLLLQKRSGKDGQDIYCAIIKIYEIFIVISLKRGEADEITKLLKEILNVNLELDWSQHHFNLLSLFCSLWEVVIKVLINNDASLSMKCFKYHLENLKCFSLELEYKVEIQKTCKTVDTIMYAWTKCCPEYKFFDWEERNLLQIFDFLEGIGGVAAKMETKCLCCSECEICSDYHTAINVTSLTGSLLRLSMNEMNVSEVMVINVLKHMERCCEHIQYLQNAKCSKWNNMWNRIGLNIYNNAVKLYSFKRDECYNYFMLFLKYLFELENIDSENPSTIFEVQSICSTLNCLSELEIQKQQYNSSLIFAALKILLYFETKDVYTQWIRAKSKCKELQNAECVEFLQQLTVICVFEQNEKTIKRFYRAFNAKLDSFLIVKLLQNELNHYQLMWPSKISMMAAVLKLHKLVDLLSMVKTLIKIWGPIPITAHKNVFNLVNKIIEDFEKLRIDSVENNIYLSSLYFIQYFDQTIETRTKTANDINSSKILEEQTELPKDPNEKCDLVSSYPSLQMDNYLKIPQLLEKALNLLGTCISTSLPSTTIETLKEYGTLNIIMNIVDEFRLQHNLLQTVTACFLSLRVSQLLKNDVFILKSISILLEEPSVNSTILKEILQEGELIETKLRDIQSDDVSEVLIEYYISKSKMYLKDKNVLKGYEEYEKACNTNVEIKDLLKIKLQMLHVKFLQLPCRFQIKRHRDQSLRNWSQLYYDITSFYRYKGSTCTATTSTMFDVNCELVDRYCGMMLPREVRCYGRSIVTLAQQLVIPTRTAYFLTTLAQADLQCSRLNDCQVKLRGLANILCLNDNLAWFQSTESNNYAKQGSVELDLIESFRDMVLDPQDAPNNKMGSTPIILINDVKLPSFIKHSTDCSCFYCSSIEYQNLVIMYFTLVAQLNVHIGNETTAKAYFVQGIKFHKHIIRKRQKIPLEIKLNETSNYYTINCFQDLLSDAYSTLLLHFGNFLLKLNDINEATKVNEQLSKLVMQSENILLRNQVEFQKLSIAMSHYEKIRSKNNVKKKELLETDEKVEIIKTPENKKNSIVIQECASSQLLSPPKRKLIKIKCDFTEMDNNCDKLELSNENSNFQHIRTPTPTRKNNELTTTKSTNKSNRKKIIKGSSTPSLTSSTKIPKTTKTVASKSVKRAALKEIPSEIVNANSPIKQKDFSFLVPSSPNAFTPNAAKVDSALNSKTKLLTRKLKSSTKKVQFVQNTEIGSEESCVTANKSVNSRIRKNLASEMCAADNEVRESIKKDTTKKSEIPKMNAAPVKRVTRSQKKTKISTS